MQAGVVLAGDRSETGTGTGYASGGGGGGESSQSRRSTGSDFGAADVATTVLLRSHPVSVWPLYCEMARVWFRSTATAWARGEEDAESATEEASLASVLPPDPQGEVCNDLCNFVASPNGWLHSSAAPVGVPPLLTLCNRGALRGGGRACLVYTS